MSNTDVFCFTVSDSTFTLFLLLTTSGKVFLLFPPCYSMLMPFPPENTGGKKPLLQTPSYVTWFFYDLSHSSSFSADSTQMSAKNILCVLSNNSGFPSFKLKLMLKISSEQLWQAGNF